MCVLLKGEKKRQIDKAGADHMNFQKTRNRCLKMENWRVKMSFCIHLLLCFFCLKQNGLCFVEFV